MIEDTKTATRQPLKEDFFHQDFEKTDTASRGQSQAAARTAHTLL